MIASLALTVFALNFAHLAHAKNIPVEHYARLPAIRDAAISPDGKSLAAIVEQNGRYVIATFDLTPTGLRNHNVFDAGDNARYNWLRWANNDRLLMSITLSEEIKKWDALVEGDWLYTSDKLLRQAQPLLDVQQAAGRLYLDNDNVAGFLPDDPDHILMVFQGDTRTRKSKLMDTYGADTADIPFSVYKVNVTTRKMQRVERGSKKLRRWISDRQGKLRIGIGYQRKGKSGENLTIDLKIKNSTGKKSEGVKHHPLLKNDVYIYGFDANPDVIYIGRHGGRDTRGLYTYNLRTKTLGPAIYHEDDHDIGGIMISVDRMRVVGYYYTDDTSRYVYFDDKAKARNARLEQKFPGFDVTTYDESPNGEWAVLHVSAPDYLPEMILYNYKTNKAATLSKLYPELKNDDIAMVVDVKYTARDGSLIPGYVTLPAAYYDSRKIEDLPFIIYPHGGPASRNYDGFDARAQFLASRGYGVLQMNFRGSTGYGKAHKDAGRKNWQVMQEDVVDGVNWLIGKGYADKDRICIMGGSYGGYAAVISAINNPDLYACAASFAGVMDIPRLVDNAVVEGRRGAVKYSVASGFKTRSEMRQQSPSRRADELKTPLLLAHGERDLIVDFKHQYKIMQSALKKSKANVTFLPLKNGDHYLSRGDNRLAYHQALDKFLGEHLGESTAP